MSTSISINVDQTEKGKKANTKASLEFFSNHNYFMKALTSWPEGHKKNPEQHLNIGGLTSINIGIIRSTLRIILWTDEAKSSLGILKGIIHIRELLGYEKVWIICEFILWCFSSWVP